MMDEKADDLVGGYLCVFLGDPKTHAPLAIFATDGHAEIFAKGIGSVQPVLTLRGWLSEYDPGCSRCHKNPASEPHTCPYAEDINGDSETQCDCCADCTSECADDI